MAKFIIVKRDAFNVDRIQSVELWPSSTMIFMSNGRKIEYEKHMHESIIEQLKAINESESK